MFILYADKNKLTLRKREAVTSGSVNAYTARFEFSADWDSLQKTAVFRAGEDSVSVLVGDGGEVVIPWEVLQKPLHLLQVGVYGVSGENLILPAAWADLGVILEGTAPGENARPPTPGLWEQELAGKADGLDYDGLTLSLLSGEKVLDSVGIAGGTGGEGGTTDHRFLTHRDAAGQHPISSIDGLEEEIKRIPAPTEALTNQELEAMLK